MKVMNLNVDIKDKHYRTAMFTAISLEGNRGGKGTASSALAS